MTRQPAIRPMSDRAGRHQASQPKACVGALRRVRTNSAYCTVMWIFPPIARLKKKPTSGASERETRCLPIALSNTQSGGHGSTYDSANMLKVFAFTPIIRRVRLWAGHLIESQVCSSFRRGNRYGCRSCKSLQTTFPYHLYGS